MHKLGSPPIGCEDFRIPGEGRPLSVMKVLCNLGKAKAKQDSISITIIFLGTQIHKSIVIY